MVDGSFIFQIQISFIFQIQINVEDPWAQRIVPDVIFWPMLRVILVAQVHDLLAAPTAQRHNLYVRFLSDHHGVRIFAWSAAMYTMV